MKNSRLSISDFDLNRVGYGQYAITYRTPSGRVKTCSHMTNSSLIDDTFNSDEPKQCDLKRLRSLTSY